MPTTLFSIQGPDLRYFQPDDCPRDLVAGAEPAVRVARFDGRDAGPGRHEALLARRGAAAIGWNNSLRHDTEVP